MINLKSFLGILIIFISKSTLYSLPTFANKLFNEGEYKRAIIEYKRLNFFSPAPHFQHQIGLCYEKMGDLEKSAEVLGEIGDIACPDLMRVYIKSDEHSLARFVCEDLDNGKELIGWIYMLEGRWDESAQTFEDIGKEDIKLAVQKGNTLPYKSENLARLFSTVIPGTGEIYSNRWLDGVLTLSFNILAGGIATKSFLDHRWLDGGLITAFFWNRFYHGGIENAAKSAKRYNKNLDEQHINSIKERYKSPVDFP